MGKPRIVAYLRASTAKQDASRAKAPLEKFAEQQEFTIDKFYIENASGTKLERPLLNELIENEPRGTVILVEQVDRLTRLNKKDFDELYSRLHSKNLLVASQELPYSTKVLNGEEDDPIIVIISDMMLKMYAHFAFKDNEDRARRRKQGNAKHEKLREKAGLQKRRGKQEDKVMLEKVAKYLDLGLTYNDITRDLHVSRQTVAKVSKRLKNDEPVYQPSERPWSEIKKEKGFD